MEQILYIPEIPGCIAGLCLFSIILALSGFAFMVYLGEWFRNNH